MKKYYFTTDKVSLEKLEEELEKNSFFTEIDPSGANNHIKLLAGQNAAFIEFFLSLKEIDPDKNI